MKKFILGAILLFSTLTFSQVRFSEYIILDGQGNVEEHKEVNGEIRTDNKQNIYIYYGNTLKLTLVLQDNVRSGTTKNSGKDYKHVDCYIKEYRIYATLMSMDNGKTFALVFNDNSILAFR